MFFAQERGNIYNTCFVVCGSEIRECFFTVFFGIACKPLHKSTLNLSSKKAKLFNTNRNRLSFKMYRNVEDRCRTEKW